VTKQQEKRMNELAESFFDSGNVHNMSSFMTGYRAGLAECEGQLEIAERMAEFMKNHSMFFNVPDWQKDSRELVDAWYKLADYKGEGNE